MVLTPPEPHPVIPDLAAFHACARANEERAAAFYEAVADTSPDAAVRALAREFAAEEHRHAQMDARVLGVAPDPGPDWLNDPAPDRR